MRMIDADELHAEIGKWPESVMYKDWVQSAIATAPTISAPQWISVEDRLPHNADEVLIYFSDGIVISGDYFDAVGFIPEHFYDGDGKISHWMPLPEPPKEVMKDGKDD